MAFVSVAGLPCGSSGQTLAAVWPTPLATLCPSFTISRRNTAGHTLCFTRERTARWVERQNMSRTCSIPKGSLSLFGFFSSIYSDMCFSFVSIELWRHWTMPSGSSATYWCTFTVTITKTRMSFAGIVTLTTWWQVVKWVSVCVVCYVIALFYSALWNTH